MMCKDMCKEKIITYCHNNINQKPFDNNLWKLKVLRHWSIYGLNFHWRPGKQAKIKKKIQKMINKKLLLILYI